MSGPTNELLLDPQLIRQLEQLELAVRRLRAGRTHGEKRSKRRGAGTEFADYRDYVQGDDPRFVDWNVYGRLDRLFLKLFHEEEDLRLAVYLDTSLSMGFGEPKKILFGKKLAAAMAYVALVNLDRASIEAANGERMERFQPARGRHQIWRLLEFLDGVKEQGGTDLHEGLRQFALRNAQPGMKVVISDFLDKRGFSGALKWLLRGPDEVIVIQILSPQEIKPPIVGDVTLEDCEDGTPVEVSITGGLLKRYDVNLRALVGGLRDYCRARGLSYFYAPSSQSLERILLDTFRRTGVLR
ncbi:MAG: DUF58 domain-containing protein [Planctomycetes bacterium]|nr:DUF58 domain-containing protein [Planctomycetota bacterium]